MIVLVELWLAAAATVAALAAAYAVIAAEAITSLVTHLLNGENQ